jgi:hypothetical protein
MFQSHMTPAHEVHYTKMHYNLKVHHPEGSAVQVVAQSF